MPFKDTDMSHMTVDTHPPLNNRIASVDIMRGLVILTMAFVNDLADFAPVADVPQWLRHMGSGVDGFTFVDMIAPIFVFVLGVSIPLALGKRMDRHESPLHVFGHVLIRTVSLIIMGLMDVNRGAGLGRPYGDMLDWPHGLWKFLAWTCIFMVWLDVPLKTNGAKTTHRAVRLAGLAGLVWLALVFRNPNGGTFTTSWWGTLGHLGWAYLIASLVWMVFRNNLPGVMGVFVLMHCLFMGIQGGLFEGGWLFKWIGSSVLSTLSANAVAGLAIGILLREKLHHGEIIRRILGIAVFTALAAFLLRHAGGLRSPSPSWSLSATSFGFAIWLALYWVVDVRGWNRGLYPIRAIGQNCLFLYQMSRYWIFIYWLSGLTFYEALGANTATGILRALVYVAFLGGITVLATRKKIILRV